MNALRERFKGKEKEVLDYTEKWGRLAAMTEYGVHCYGSFSRWVGEASGDEYMGIAPKFGGFGATGHLDILKAVHQRLENFVSTRKALDEAKDKRIADLETKLEMYERGMYKHIGRELEEIMEILET